MAKGIAKNPDMWLAIAQDTQWAAELPDNIEVLVLSLGCTLDQNNKLLATSSVSSLRAGIEQYKNWRSLGKNVKLVCVGSGYHQEMPHYEWDLMMDMALNEKVPAEDLFGEPRSFNTPMNAVCVAAGIKGKRIGSIILTSDPLHSDRALKTFQEVFRVMGITTPITAVPGKMPVYGNSSKWFLRKKLLWKVWNQVGKLVLPGQVKKLELALRD